MNTKASTVLFHSIRLSRDTHPLVDNEYKIGLRFAPDYLNNRDLIEVTDMASFQSANGTGSFGDVTNLLSSARAYLRLRRSGRFIAAGPVPKTESKGCSIRSVAHCLDHPI